MTVDTVEARVPLALGASSRPRSRKRRLLAWSLGGLIALSGGGWLGLQVEPDPLAPADVRAGPVVTVPLPDGLPAPVERFYRALYGDRLPVVDSAVISGRGRMRIAGISFPARFRFSHVAGHDYRHYIELTAFGRRLLTVDEHFVEGRGSLELPFGTSRGPNIDQGANLALWAEAVWMPSVWITDARADWQPVDDTSARLTVPFGEATETFLVHFDAVTGLLERMESMRFKGVDDTVKTRWVNEVSEWAEPDGHPAPSRATVTWGDEQSPWADLQTDELVYNADLRGYIQQDGP